MTSIGKRRCAWTHWHGKKPCETHMPVRRVRLFSALYFLAIICVQSVNSFCAGLSEVKALLAMDECFQFHTNYAAHGEPDLCVGRYQTDNTRQLRLKPRLSGSFYYQPCSWFLRSDTWLHPSLSWLENVHARIKQPLNCTQGLWSELKLFKWGEQTQRVSDILEYAQFLV